jgi:hypothetical protein
MYEKTLHEVRAGLPLLSWQGLLFVSALAALALLLYAVSSILTRRRLQRWAASRGVRLVEYSTVPFWSGPRAFRRTRYQVDYRVVVEEASGRRRAGWLLENWPFLDLGHPDYQLEWDDE